jgi:hypothetical protein
VCLVALLLLSLGATAGAKPGPPGKGTGRVKVTLCHKGKTIRVAAPAVKAHLRHGDRVGRCSLPAPAPGTARLTVIKHVINDNGGTKAAGDFTITINGVSATGGNTFAGSEAGVTKMITTFGAYSVTESSASGYALTSVGDCAGTVAAGQEKVCLLVNNDMPGQLTVVKQVTNDSGGTEPVPTTITINGVTVIGGNSFPARLERRECSPRSAPTASPRRQCQATRCRAPRPVARARSRSVRARPACSRTTTSERRGQLDDA